MIDFNHDGEVLRPTLIDIPKKGRNGRRRIRYSRNRGNDKGKDNRSAVGGNGDRSG